MRILLTAYVRFRNALAWHAFELAGGLHRAGHEVLLFCQRESPLASWCANAPFASDSRFNLNRFHPREIAGGMSAMRRALRDFRPDILNPHCPPGHSFAAAARALCGYHAPLVRTVADPRPPQSNPTNRYLHRRLTDGVLFTSQSSQERYRIVFGDTRACARVILPGFRADDFTRDVSPSGLRQQLGLREEDLLIGVIARMSPEKGQEVLLEALSRLTPSERDSIFVVLAGEDSRERGHRDLMSIAQRFGVERHLCFLGELSDVRPTMSELDLGIITSTRSEAICRVALEYMSFGIPIIASDTNILKEVVLDGVNGWTHSTGDARQLAECIRQALHSPTERHRLGNVGRAMVRDVFSLDREVEETVTFYEQLLRAPRGKIT